jgi:REP element-mobilizing transposase RayT
MFTAGHAYRRRLPHFQKEGRTYFVTFNTFNRWRLPPLARDIVLNHIKFDHQRRIWISIALVMPDHVHLIGTPIDFALHRILKGIKGSSARSVNKALDRRGPVWQDESFDHELRRDESLQQKAEYIAMNPVRKGLVERPEEYRWLWIPE